MLAIKTLNLGTYEFYSIGFMPFVKKLQSQKFNLNSKRGVKYLHKSKVQFYSIQYAVIKRGKAKCYSLIFLGQMKKIISELF